MTPKLIEKRTFCASLPDGTVAGTASLIIDAKEDDCPAGLIEDVFVRGDCRRRGIGRRLVQEIIQHVKEVNCYKLWFVCRTPEAKAFYKSCGFRVDSQTTMRMNFY